jgi:protein HokB
VTSSICAIARLTCSIPVLCSVEAAAISAMMLRTRSIESTISRMAPPASSTNAEPSRTRSADSTMRSLISFAAVALR